MVFPNLINAVTTFFEREEIPYAVIGAFALGAYGYSRATRDIDFIAPLRAQNSIVEFLLSLGYETLHKSDGFSNHLHPISSQRLDFLYVNEPTMTRLIDGSQLRTCIDEIVLPVVSPKHLVELKLFAISNDSSRKLKDLSDITELLNHVELNRVEVEALFRKYSMGADIRTVYESV